ncbi:MAG: hypothetical protein ACREQZ_05510 [Woeseiaceae bacterium]
MSNINWARLTLGALITAAICFISDGFLHQRLIDGQWAALAAALQITMREHAGWMMIYFVIFELGRGFLTLFVYALMRPKYGAGPLTAVWAGVVAWFAYSLTGPVQFIPLGFFSSELWLAAAGYQLVASVIAAVAGAAPYKE